MKALDLFRRIRFDHVLCTTFVAVTASWCPSSEAYTFADGLKMVNGIQVYHENDSHVSDEPVHVLLPEATVGPGSSIRSAASLAPGLTEDGITLSPLTLKSRANLGQVPGTTDQIELRGQAIFKTPFEILTAGPQTVSVAWNGHLHASGNGVASYTLRLGFNPYNGVYSQLTASGTVNETIPGNVSDTDSVIDQEETILVDLPSSEVGTTYNLQVWLTTYAALPYGGGSTEGAFSDFYDSFRVTGWSEGLYSLDELSVPPLLQSDFNGDGAVDAADASILFANWGDVPPGDPIADLNGDDIVDAADASIVFAEWTGDAVVVVPEPMGFVLLLIATFGLRPGIRSTQEVVRF